VVLAEVFLWCISLPLYLAAPKATVGEDVSQYRIRRVVNVSVLAAIFFIWLLKLAFIIGVSIFFDPRAQYSVREITTRTDALNTIVHEVVIAPENSALKPPTVVSVYQGGSDEVIVEGTAPAGEIVALSFARRDGKEHASALKLYTGQADAKGTWQIAEDRNVFGLAPGPYAASARTYDAARHVKSASSAPVGFEVHRALWRRAFEKMDMVFNIAMIGLIIVGVVTTALTF